MTAHLTTYIGNLTDAREQIGDTQDTLKTIHFAVKQVESGLEKLETIEKNTDALESIAKNLETAMKFVSKFGAFGKVVEDAIAPVLKVVRQRIEDLNDKSKEVKSTFGKYENAAEAMRIAIETFQFDLEVRGIDIDSYLGSLEEAKATLDAGNTAGLPQGFLDTLAAIEADFAAENGKYADIQADLEAMKQQALAMVDETLAFNGLVGKLELISDGFNEIMDVFGFLEKPMEILSDALEPVEWILDAADAVFDKVFNPILDPIKDAFKIDDLLDAFSDKVAGLLPDVDLLNPFLGLEEKLDKVFGEPSMFDDIKSPWDDTPSIEGSIVARLFGENGLLAAVQGNGEYLATFFAGRNDILSEKSTLTGTDAADILTGGAGDDTLYGGGGDYNIFIAGSGDDTFVSTGIDAVFFTDALPNYSFSWSTDETDLFFDHSNAAQDSEGDGVDTAYDVDWFVFSDMAYTRQQLVSAIFAEPGVNPTPGTRGDDLIFGTTGANTIIARDGHDNIYGGDGFDSIHGGRGRDTYSYAGESFGDPVFYDPGAFVVLDRNADASLLAQRTDILVKIENVFGSRDNDTIIADNGANVLSGGEGSDTILGAGGADTIFGGGQSDVLIGGRGDDVIYSGGAVDVFIGGRGNDLYVSDPVRDGISDFDMVWYGGYRADLLQRDLLPSYEENLGPLGDDALDDLPHHLMVDYATDSVMKYNANGGLLGTDTLSGINLVVATENDDILRGGAGAAAIDENGDPVNPRGVALEGAGGNDTFYGYEAGAGDLVQLRGSTYMGGAGEDILFGYNGNDIFVGGDGDDTYRLFIDEDTYGVRVGKGHFFGGSTNVFDTEDPHDGGLDFTDDGHDTMDVSQTGYRWVWNLENDVSVAYDLTVDVENSETNARHAATIEVYGVEAFIASDFDDTFIGTAGSDLTFDGRAGDDVIRTSGAAVNDALTVFGRDGDDDFFGGRGTDTFYGGDGNDFLADLFDGQGDNNMSERQLFHAGTGEDIVSIGRMGVYDFFGGAGSDILSLAGLSEGVDVDLTTGVAALGSRLITIKGFEAFRGTMGDDSIAGTARADVLAAVAGDDSIAGRGGSDVIYGSNGDNRLFGGSGSDMIFAGRGDNTIDGGRGYDTLNLQPDQLEVTREGWKVSDVALHDGQWQVDLIAGTLINIDNGTIFGTSAVDRIEAVIGGVEGDTILGRNAADVIDGAEGGDTIDGRGGADALTGGDGDDEVYGGGGADAVTLGTGDNSADGGRGRDTLHFNKDAQVNVIDLATGRSVSLDDTGGEVGTDAFTGFELYRGGAAADLLTGSGDTGLTLKALNTGATPHTDYLRSDIGADMPSGDMTLELVINGQPPATGSYCLVSYASDSTLTNAFTIFSTGGQLRLIVNNHTIDTNVPEARYLDGANHRLSVTMQAATGDLAVFIDGDQVWSATVAQAVGGVNSGGVLFFGQDQDAFGGGLDPNQAYEGLIGDIRLFGDLRTQQEIATQARQPIDSATDGLVGYWSVDENGGVETRTGQAMFVNGAGGATGGTTATRGRDVLRGGAGNDMLYGGARDDQLYGGTGDDTLEGGFGDDLIDGGNGFDLVSFAGANAGLTFDLGNANANTGLAAGDTYVGIEGVIGGQADDDLFGDAAANVLRGGAGDDRLFGRGGNDTLRGDDGADTLDGGAGIDTAEYSGDAFVRVDLVNGGANSGAAAGDVLISIENVTSGDGGSQVYGSALGNTLTGGAGEDVLESRGGADLLFGGLGHDLLSGGGKADMLYGGDGSDSLFGGAGGDVLVGGDGSNVLFGGGGQDTFMVGDTGTSNDEWTGGRGADTFVFDATREAGNFVSITDFGNGNDVMRFVGATYDDLTIGNVDATKSYIIYGDVELIFVQGVEAGTLTEDRFEFA